MKFVVEGLRVLLLAAIGAALIACGGDDDNGDASIAPSAPVAQLELSLTPQSVKTFRFSWIDTAGETEYRLLENPDGVSGYTVVARIAADATGHEHLAFLPGRINASYVLQACNDAGCIDSEPVYVDDRLSDAVGYVKADNTSAGDEFGFDVALAADGETLAVGAPFEDGSGAVYVFARNGSTWTQQEYVKAATPGPADEFGTSVALAADGDTLAVGAPFEDSAATGIDGDATDNNAPDSGAVYIFARSGSAWTQQAYIKAANADAIDRFGASIALAAAGDTLAVGAALEDSAASGVNGNAMDNSAAVSGAVYVFALDGTWAQQAYVKAAINGTGDRFGASVALAADGDTLAIGAPSEDSAAVGVGGDATDNSAFASGAVYVFARSGAGWTQQAYVKAAITGAEDEFGASVALAADGDTLAVGAFLEDSAATGIGGDATDNNADRSGAAYVFARNAGIWAQQAYVKAANTGADDLFGLSVALAADGDTLAVGAPFEGSAATGIGGDPSDDSADFSGAVYVFARSAGVWSQQAYVKATNTGDEDRFGQGIALANGGPTLAVGARRESSAATGIGGDAIDDSSADSGAAYLY
ncbi:hypothetical protein [Halofilum ochraceum]|uniref:hypothetical protein n=1 Tax=Halofilum ochraceum TaxID=1611323 RepID=UPI000946B8BA|nr:hypothetical protein [Halofilum ochraceum]